MRRSLYILLIASCVLFACTSTQEIRETPQPEKHLCRLTVILNYETVCLDGEWKLSSGILGTDAAYTFKQVGRQLYLIPVLSAEAKKKIRQEIGERSLDTSSIEEALSIQGTLYNDMLYFEQYNALVPWQETSRIQLYWRQEYFEGSSEKLSARESTPKTEKISLKRIGNLHQNTSWPAAHTPTY